MRLTEKLKDKKGVYYNLIESDLVNGYQAVDKLGQLEDIEEKLGIDLITLFKIFSEKDIFIKESYTGEIINRGSFYPNIKYKEIHDGYSWHLKFEDYGKTWALTKEELL